MNYEMGPEREADHQWWISNISKVRKHYKNWDIRINLEEIFKEIHDSLVKASG